MEAEIITHADGTLAATIIEECGIFDVLDADGRQIASYQGFGADALAYERAKRFAATGA